MIEIGKRYRDPLSGFEGNATQEYQGTVYLVGDSDGGQRVVKDFDSDKVEPVEKDRGAADARSGHRFKS